MEFDNLRSKAQQLFKERKYEESIKAFTEAINVKPTLSILYHKKSYLILLIRYKERGGAYEGVNKFKEALDDFNMGKKLQISYISAVELDPQCVDYLNCRGAFFENKVAQFEPALENYTKALKLDPKSKEALNNRASIYNKLQEYQIIW